MDRFPDKWWQWLLMYPTIVLALGGAIPQYYQWASAANHGLGFAGNVKLAEEQDKAWQRNLDCLRAIDHIKPGSSTNYAIDLVSCPSGDILVTLTPLQNPNQQISHWIVTSDLFTQSARSLFSISAMAQEAPPRPGGPVETRIIDTRKDGAVVTRRIQLSDSSCVDQTIDTYTGRRIDQKPAACSRF
ncbi:hypothetical protein [Bradyrhizobium sp.]|uniref:hypothetical protein n=1 Tax=Bradyrhizobium sp. TaxID=376 RepID=UPI001EB1F9E8|nr:hypothetical protein [Bradyrhizobium sp.]MBV9981085.1 hypothetical protein [Bradyrhizobium sp.]